MFLKYRCEAAAKGDDRAEKLPAVITAADAVLSAINTTDLAAFMALRPPAEDEDSNGSSSSNGADTSSSSSSDVKGYKEQKAERDAEKSALLEALKTKLKAQLEIVEVCLTVSARCLCNAGGFELPLHSCQQTVQARIGYGGRAGQATPHTVHEAA